MIVDSLTFLGEALRGPSVTAAELLARLDEAGIDRAVVAPAKPPGYHLGPANDAVAAAARAHPDRLVGLGRVDPNQPDAAAELERAAELGLRGLFLHPWEELFRVNAPLVDPVLHAARRLGLPAVVATGYPWLSEALQVGDLARRFPEVPIVMTNGGQLNISGLGQTDAELALAGNANLSLQTAGVYREDFIEGCVARFGAERVLYASAFPQLDPRLELRRVQWAPNIDGPAQAAILGGNAARILGRRLMAFLPREFEVPAVVETPRFRMRSITIHDAIKDYDAVMTSVDHLRELFGEGWGWPDPDLTLEDDLIELGWHQSEFRRRSSFDYAVMELDESRLLGCVYVDPPTRPGWDAEVFYWARQSELASGLEEELGSFVRGWLEREWPFERVAFPGRDIPWREWLA